MSPPVAQATGDHSLLPTATIGASLPTRRRMRDNPWFVLAMLFLVLGPFALPMLWASRGFGQPAKTVLTAAILCMGAYAIWIIYQAYLPLFDVLHDLNRV